MPRCCMTIHCWHKSLLNLAQLKNFETVVQVRRQNLLVELLEFLNRQRLKYNVIIFYFTLFVLLFCSCLIAKFPRLKLILKTAGCNVKSLANTLKLLVENNCHMPSDFRTSFAGLLEFLKKKSRTRCVWLVTSHSRFHNARNRTRRTATNRRWKMKHFSHGNLIDIIIIVHYHYLYRCIIQV